MYLRELVEWLLSTNPGGSRRKITPHLFPNTSDDLLCDKQWLDSDYNLSDVSALLP